MLKEQAYHIKIKRLDTNVEKWFMIAKGEWASDSTNAVGADTLAPKTSNWDITLSDFTNSSVFAQSDWSWNRNVNEARIVWPAWVKYWTPETSYSNNLPTCSFWQSNWVDVETVQWEIRLDKAAMLAEDFDNPATWFDRIAEINWKMYASLKWTTQIYRSTDWWLTWSTFLDISTDSRFSWDWFDQVIDMQTIEIKDLTDSINWFQNMLFFIAKNTSNSNARIFRCWLDPVGWFNLRHFDVGWSKSSYFPDWPTISKITWWTFAWSSPWWSNYHFTLTNQADLLNFWIWDIVTVAWVDHIVDWVNWWDKRVYSTNAWWMWADTNIILKTTGSRYLMSWWLFTASTWPKWIWAMFKVWSSWYRCTWGQDLSWYYKTNSWWITAYNHSLWAWAFPVSIILSTANLSVSATAIYYEKVHSSAIINWIMWMKIVQWDKDDWGSTHDREQLFYWKDDWYLWNFLWESWRNPIQYVMTTASVTTTYLGSNSWQTVLPVWYNVTCVEYFQKWTVEWLFVWNKYWTGITWTNCAIYYYQLDPAYWSPTAPTLLDSIEEQSISVMKKTSSWSALYIWTNWFWRIYKYTWTAFTLEFTLPIIELTHNYIDDIETFWNDVYVSCQAIVWIYKYNSLQWSWSQLFSIPWKTPSSTLRIVDIHFWTKYLFVWINSSASELWYYDFVTSITEWSLTSSIYHWWIPWVNKSWLYAKVLTHKWPSETWQKISLAVSFDSWVTFSYVPTIKWGALYSGTLTPDITQAVWSWVWTELFWWTPAQDKSAVWQSFFVPNVNDIIITTISASMFKFSTPTDNIYMEIWDWSFNVLDTSDSIIWSTLTWWFLNYTFNFSWNVTLPKNATYYFVLKRSWARDTVKNYLIQQSTAASYSGWSSYTYSWWVWLVPVANNDLTFSIQCHSLYTSTYSKVLQWVEHRFYFPYNTLNRDICYRVEIVKGSSTAPIVWVISLHYNIVEEKEFVFTYLLSLADRQILLDWTSEVNKHIEKLNFIKDIWENDIVCEISHVDWVKYIMLPFKPVQAAWWWISIVTSNIIDKAKDKNYLQYLASIQFKTIAIFN